jgi:hypothetical protein
MEYLFEMWKPVRAGMIYLLVCQDIYLLDRVASCVQGTDHWIDYEQLAEHQISGG